MTVDLAASPLGLLAALGIGLLIGIERERSKGTGPDRRPAGVRTFALTALLGAVGYLVGGPAGIAVATLIATSFATVAHIRSKTADPGLTTEVALVLTSALGGLAQIAPELGAALGVVVALLLVSRDWLHGVVRDKLTAEEITDAVLLAAAALVILPLLPDRAIDPFGVVNPRLIWKLAVVVMLINAGGYLAVRALGASAGLPLAGLAGGFASSAATIGTMGQRAKQTPALAWAAAAGAAMSSVATVVELAIIIGIANRALLAPLWLSLAGSGLVALAYGGALSWKSLRSPDAQHVQQGRAFQPRTAILFAVVLSAVIFASAALQHYFGARGSLIGIAVAGFADAHSSTASAATLAQSGGLAPATAIVAILLAFTTNTVTKLVVAWWSGGARFAAQLAPGLLLMLVAAWAGAFAGPLSLPTNL